VRPWEFTRITPSLGTVAAETVSFAAAALADFFAAAFADVAAVVVLVLDELDELLPQPAAATANTGSIKITHIFFTRFSFRRRHSRAPIRDDRGRAGRHA
jgi:hypothetical protein